MKELFNGIELSDAELEMVLGGADTATTNTASASQTNDKTVVANSSDGSPDLSKFYATMDSLDRPLTVTSAYKYTSSSNTDLSPLGGLLGGL
ncbi:MAG: hypothetical protein JO202_02600 [Ktedonobacteraceae bacterium]|nr:hypothetical protein [Ktedonobacteraceae bacterium]